MNCCRFNEPKPNTPYSRRKEWCAFTMTFLSNKAHYCLFLSVSLCLKLFQSEFNCHGSYRLSVEPRSCLFTRSSCFMHRCSHIQEARTRQNCLAEPGCCSGSGVLPVEDWSETSRSSLCFSGLEIRWTTCNWRGLPFHFLFFSHRGLEA